MKTILTVLLAALLGILAYELWRKNASAPSGAPSGETIREDVSSERKTLRREAISMIADDDAPAMSPPHSNANAESGNREETRDGMTEEGAEDETEKNAATRGASKTARRSESARRTRRTNSAATPEEDANRRDKGKGGAGANDASANSGMEEAKRLGVRFSKDGRVLIEYPKKIDLKSFRIPDGVTVIGAKAFQECQELESVELPASVREIHPFAFFSCRNLRKIGLNSGLERIGRYAFARCKNLESPKLPSSLRALEAGAFANCTSIQSIRIPAGIARIEAKTFLWCSSLQTATLHDGCLRIDSQAFMNCKQLRRLLPWISSPDSYEYVAVRKRGLLVREKRRKKYPIMDELGAFAFENTPLEEIVLQK